MASWKTTLAIAAAGALIAGPASAQSATGSTSPGTTEPSKDAGQMPKSSDTTSGTMKSGTGADTMKSDPGMQSHTGMKSGAAHGRKGGMAMGDEKVKAAQQALKEKGHDPGDVDGKMGPKTQAALRDYQKAQGMQATGRLDAKTMQSLGMDGTKTSSADQSSGSGSASPSTGSSISTPSTSTPSAPSNDAMKDTSGAKKSKDSSEPKK